MEILNSCVSNVVSSWRAFTSHLNSGFPVHPVNPFGPEFCDFITISTKVRIRVIHLTPDDVRNSIKYSNSIRESFNSKRSSLSEEYWFTKWKQPLKRSSCNCSFRRSFRYSLLSTKSNNDIEENAKNTSFLESLPSKIINVEIFVERLIQDTFFEAFQEYYMSKVKNGLKGNINFAYQNTETIGCNNSRLKGTDSLNSNNVSTNFDKNNETSHVNYYSNQPACLKVQKPTQKLVLCDHKKSFQKKPLLMFLHGVGDSADIWWLIMNNMISKGYEVIAPDLLGHGYSAAPDKPNFYTFQNLLIHVISIFDHYMGTEIKRKCILIGHAYGCSIATALYSHRAIHISQLILISGGGPNPLAAPAKNNEISPFNCLYTLLHPLLWCGVKRSFFYASRGKHFIVANKDCAIPKHILQYTINGQNWPEGDAAFHRRILVPTLLVHGLLDKEVTLVQECEMERTIPRAFLELIPNAGHMPMIETPEHLSHMILCFITSWI